MLISLKQTSGGPFALVVVGDVPESVNVQSIVKETVATFGTLYVVRMTLGLSSHGIPFTNIG